MDKQPVGQVNSNTWSDRASRKYEGVKPPVPPKPPRKSLSSQVSDPSHPGNRQSISRGFYHPHYLTLSHSRKAPSFDYLSDSGTQFQEVPFKRASSIDGSSSGDWSLYNTTRLSTFISNEKRPDSSTASSIKKSGVSDNIKLFSQTANHNQITNDNHNNNIAPLPVAYRANTLGRSNTIANSFNKQALKQLTSSADDDKVCERNRSSLPGSAKPVNQAILNTHLRSKSEHHPRCPNRNIVLEKVQDFDQMSRQTASHNLKTTQSVTNLNFNHKSSNLPSSKEALQSIKSVIEPIYKISDACSDACNHFPPFLLHNYLNGSPASSSENCTEDSDCSMSFKSCNSNSSSSSLEYLNHKSNSPKDAETYTDDCLVLTEGVNGEKVYVKLRRPMPQGKFEDKNTITDQSLTADNLDENPFEGLKRGSKVSRKSVSGDGRSSLRKSKTIGKNTLERRKKTRSLNVYKRSLSHETASLDRRASHHVDSDSTHQSDLDRNSYSRLSFDENKEWEKVAEIVASFGSSFLKTSEKLDLSSSFFSSKVSVDEWLSDISLNNNYTELFNSNGYDCVEFMNCLSENDLLEMGITDEEDRSKLLDAAARLPSVKKLSDEQDKSLLSWLSSLKLDQYEPIFIEKGYDDLDKVRKLWDVELTAVLQINKLGHKRRILASLGKDSNLINDFTLSFDKLNFDVAELHDFDLQNLPDSRPESKLEVSSARASDIESDRMSISSDIRIETNESIPNSMHSSITSSTPISTQWKHDPLELYKNGCAYKASYLGSTLVSELEGIKSTRESILKLRNSTKGINKIPSVTLQISHTGVKFIDSQMNKLVCEHEIRNIHCACQDADDFMHFAYITKDHGTNNDFCHVFCAENIETATEIILTLGQAFDIAYRLAVGEDINTLRENFIESYHQE